jgi:uncharacterized repeat protein (TIGR03809 family)
MADMIPRTMSAATMSKWYLLAEERSRHLAELHRTGRWRRYYTKEQIATHMTEAAKTARQWRLLMETARAETALSIAAVMVPVSDTPTAPAPVSTPIAAPERPPAQPAPVSAAAQPVTPIAVAPPAYKAPPVEPILMAAPEPSRRAAPEPPSRVAPAKSAGPQPSASGRLAALHRMVATRG